MEKEIHIQLPRLDLVYEGDDFEGCHESIEALAGVFSEFLESMLSIAESHFILNLTLCSADKIKQLNSDYRDKPKVTDVLSFPIQDNVRLGEYDSFLPEIELGDIFVCDSVCADQAREFKIEFREEFIHLAVHGFLHLCGYDHELSEEEEVLMEGLEEELISRFSVSLKKL